MSTCYVIPGFMGTELSEADPGLVVSTVWVNYAFLADGLIMRLALAPDGVTPLPPNGKQCVPGAPLPAYYGGAIKLLTLQLAGDGYRVVPFGWDFRKSFLIAGLQLANIIAINEKADAPCSIAAHSAGGLVARQCWVALNAMGKGNLCRRIVTIGCPHYGTYNIIHNFNGNADTINQLYYLNQAVAVANQLNPFLPTFRTSKNDIRQVAATWPGSYELFPVVGSPSDVDDPNRKFLFNAANWPDEFTNLTQDRLSNSLDVTGPWLKDPSTMPPAWVLTTVAGKGLPTPNRLIRPGRLGQLFIPGASIETLGFTDDGDGTATIATALVANSTQIILDAGHMDLPNEIVRRGDLREMILEVRNPPDPVPAIEDMGGPLMPVLQGPPSPGQVAGSQLGGPCSSGKCLC